MKNPTYLFSSFTTTAAKCEPHSFFSLCWHMLQSSPTLVKPRALKSRIVSEKPPKYLTDSFLCLCFLSSYLLIHIAVHKASLRKEVIQPQLPLQLPCYDFVPITNAAFGSSPLAVSFPTSGVTSSHDVTGGVYKDRERIHRTLLTRGY